MNEVAITKYSLIVGFIVYCCWDVYVALFNKIPNSKDTISGISYSSGRKFTAIPLMVGAILGHLWWPMSYAVPQPWMLLLGILVLGSWSYLAYKFRERLWKFKWIPIVWLIVGIPHGHFFWPQVVSS